MGKSLLLSTLTYTLTLADKRFFITSQLPLAGFLSTGDEVVPGNMAFKDQRLALRWLQDNVRSFGGDPDRVTIYGQSTGAISVYYQMLFSAHEGKRGTVACS